MAVDPVAQNLFAARMEQVKNQTDRLKTDVLKEEQLKEACQGFESIFLNTVLKSMRDTLPGEALLDGSHGMDIYQSMHDQYLAEELSRNQFAMGIKEFLYDELKKSI